MPDLPEPRETGHQVTVKVGRDAHVATGAVLGLDNSKGKFIFLEPPSKPDTWRRTRQVIALVAGMLLLAASVTLAAIWRDMSAPLYTFLRINTALGAAAFAAFIDGFLSVRFKAWLRAAGGFAVFVIVYFFPVAAPTSATPPPAAGGTAVPLPSPPTLPAAR